MTLQTLLFIRIPVFTTPVLLAGGDSAPVRLPGSSRWRGSPPWILPGTLFVRVGFLTFPCIFRLRHGGV